MTEIGSAGGPHEAGHGTTLRSGTSPDGASGAGKIAGALGRAILAGRLGPGDLVPGEIEVGRRFEASRTVVREAFKTLSAKGLIESRRRAGTRVRARAAWHLLDADVLAWRLDAGEGESKFVADLLHVRAVIEPAAAAMAALRHDDATLAAIEAAFAGMERTAHDRELFAAPDLAFHKAILAATGNDVMMALGALIEAALGAFLRIASRHPGAPGPSVPLHGAVLAAIRRRDPEAAERAMMALLDRTATNARRNTAGDHGEGT